MHTARTRQPKVTPELLDRAPPHNLDAERGVIGSILLDPGKHDDVASVVCVEHFHDVRNATLFGHLSAMRNGGSGAIDITLLKQRLRTEGDLEKAGGAAYLAEVLQSVPYAENAKHYAGIVRELAAQRALIHAGTEMLRDGYSGQMTAAEMIQRVQINLERAASQSSQGPCFGPVLLRLSDVKSERIEWLWPGRIAIGKLTLFAGDPGLGKSLITLDIAARVSKGLPWPDSSESPQPGNVVMLSAEDDPADTIRPRLDAAGADVSRISLLQAIGTIDEADGTRIERTFCLDRDMATLSQVVVDTPNCRMVVIDPISAYLGRTDSHKNSEIRGLLAPLAEMAQKHRVAVVVITHLNKSGGPAMYRSMGSLAFVAAARMVWAVAKDPEDASKRLVLPVKCNIAPDVSGLSYKVVDTDGAACLAWSPEPIDVPVDDVLTAGSEREAVTEKDEAKEFLRQVLADGPVPSKAIKAEASANGGPSWRTIRRAQVEMGIQPYREGFGKGAVWMWALPDPPEAHRWPRNTIDGQPQEVDTFDKGGHLCTNGGEANWTPQERAAYEEFMG